MKNLNCIQLATRCIGLALIGGALLTSHVWAAEPSDFHSTTVKFADLNLQTREGVEALYKRIHRASTQVCASGDERALATLTFRSKCVAESEIRAIQNVNDAALSAFYQAKMGGPNAMVAMSNGK